MHDLGHVAGWHMYDLHHPSMRLQGWKCHTQILYNTCTDRYMIYMIFNMI